MNEPTELTITSVEYRPNYDEFQKKLAELINYYSLEYTSSTPDYILAELMVNHLKAFDSLHEQRDKFNNR